jgi:hypothetical protein
MSMDKYLEKMVLVPLERWEQLLIEEKETRQDSDTSTSEDDAPFPVIENIKTTDKNEQVKSDDNKLAPPGIPSMNIEPKVEDDNNYESDVKRRKKKNKEKKKIESFQWKNLP